MKPALPTRPPAQTAPRLLLLSYLLVGVVALLLRVLDLGIFVTHDEAEFWIDRSEQFLLALQGGDYAGTAISTHPGVTTMWLGMVGIFLRRAARALGILQEVPFPTLLALMQLSVALVHTAGVVAGYALLRRLLPGAVALLAALLWATDPFIIGYSRLLHVDMLVGSFATLSLLAACVAWQHHAPPRGQGVAWLLIALSGVCGGLAVLSKSPGLAVVPIVGLLALSAWKMENGKWSIGKIIGGLLLWGIVFAITVPVVWPAVWAAPGQVYTLLRVGVEVEGGSPHMLGNFFMGQEDPAPGPLFYPVALALRTTPWALAGLLLLPLAAWPRRRSGASLASPSTLRTLAALAAFVLLFVVGLSFFLKKFNRYLVPAFPALDILAAVGLAWGIEQITRLARLVGRARQWGQHTLLGGVTLAALLNAAWFHPYGITYFNQALGGPPAGARTFSVGWGEGLGQVAAWLNQQPDITGVVTAAIMMKSLNPYLLHGAQATTPRTAALPDKTGYVVVYIYQAQGTVFPPFDRFYEQASPAHVVTIHGVDYAWIYQVPPPVAHPRPATFGEAIFLRGFATANGQPPGSTREIEARRGEPLVFKLFWGTATLPPADYWLFAHLLSPDGLRLFQADIPLSTGTWGAHRFVTTRLPVSLPPDAPPGHYLLTVGLYDPASKERLPLSAAAAANPALDGPHALLLARVRVQ